MEPLEGSIDRRKAVTGILGLGAALMLAPAAVARGFGLSSILGIASDRALDKLAVPGAFYDDEDIRIGLPFVGDLGGGGGILGSVLGATSRLGILDGLIRKLNNAAGVAAGEAKPIFRAAIDDLSFSDVPGIVKEDDGATQYLRRSAGDELNGKLRPHVDGALGETGAYDQLDELSEKHSFLRTAGITRDGLGNSVTEQALNGIFRYIGAEEAKLRADPLGKAGGLLKGVLGD